MTIQSIQAFVTETADQDVAAPGIIDSLSGMSTQGKVILGVGTAVVLGGVFAAGAWWSGRRAEKIAAEAAAKPAPTVIPAAPTPAPVVQAAS